MRSRQLLDAQDCLFDGCFLLAQFVQDSSKIHFSPGVPPFSDHINRPSKKKYWGRGISEKIYNR